MITNALRIIDIELEEYWCNCFRESKMMMQVHKGRSSRDVEKIFGNTDANT